MVKDHLKILWLSAQRFVRQKVASFTQHILTRQDYSSSLKKPRRSNKFTLGHDPTHAEQSHWKRIIELSGHLNVRNVAVVSEACL